MSSIYALVLICEEGIEEKALADLQKLRQHKDYCFTLKGWSDLALYIVDIPAQRLYCNKAGAKEKALYEFACRFTLDKLFLQGKNKSYTAVKYLHILYKS